ncbi:MAG: HEAT repeat domain-containing protein [Anaerolineae bacterium]
MHRIARFLKIQPAETRLVALQAGLVFCVSAGGAIGGSAIDALFFARFGAQYLPYLYMIVSVITFVVLMGMTAITARVPRTRLYVALPIGLAAILVAERLVLAFDVHWSYPVVWLSMSVIGTVQGLYVWGLASSIVDTRQAKRLFPIFGASIILGAVVGGFLTAPLAQWLKVENLLLIWATGLAGAFFLGRILIRQALPQSRSPRQPIGPLDEIKIGYRFVRGSRLMRWIVASGILFAILGYSLSLPYAKAAALEFPQPDQLAGFLGTFQGITTAVALIVSLLFANRLYARLGLMTARLGLPVIYLIGFSALMIAPVFPAIVAFRFMEQTWSQGISSAAYQAVFNVVPPSQREQTRAFIGAVPDQIGTLLAGLILAVGQQTLSASQLYSIGLITAAIIVVVVWQQKRAYAGALVESLRAGQPHVFFDEADPFGGLRGDAAALSTVLAGLSSTETAVRRVSIDILGQLPVPAATERLIGVLDDPDAEVRVAALRALACARASSALLEIAACLNDPEADVRAAAIASLRHMAGHGRSLPKLIRPRLDDTQPQVKAQAAAMLWHVGVVADARVTLKNMLASSDGEFRLEALKVLRDIEDPTVHDWLASALSDPVPAVRRAAAAAVPSSASTALTDRLVCALGDDDADVQIEVAAAIGRVGPTLLQATVAALSDPALEAGALLALQHLPAHQAAAELRSYAQATVARAVRYHQLRQGLHLNGDERSNLLADSLRDAAHRQALHALRAIGLLGDRSAVTTTLENLTSRDTNQRATAVETLESIGEREIVQPLLSLWESNETASPSTADNLSDLLTDADEWLRACANFALAGEINMHTLPTLSLMERVLFLRRVPLFAEVTPLDLKRVAMLAGERLFHAGEFIARQGDPGDELFIILSGKIVVREGADDRLERTVGDVVGEMSLITQEPRMASLVAAEPVRVLSVDRPAFETMLRERPAISLAVMRVLIARLKESEVQARTQA